MRHTHVGQLRSASVECRDTRPNHRRTGVVPRASSVICRSLRVEVTPVADSRSTIVRGYGICGKTNRSTFPVGLAWGLWNSVDHELCADSFGELYPTSGQRQNR